MTSDDLDVRSPWRVDWSAVWVGGLTAVVVGLLIGMSGFAVGAHEASTTIDWHKVRLLGAAFSIGGAFFAFVAGGWAAGRIAGTRRSEAAMLHGAIVWLLGTLLLVGLATVGAVTHFGGWYGGLVGAPTWAATPPVDATAAVAARNMALATLISLLLGLVGGVLGGWLASGEPMTLTYYRRRQMLSADRVERARRIA